MAKPYFIIIYPFSACHGVLSAIALCDGGSLQVESNAHLRPIMGRFYVPMWRKPSLPSHKGWPSHKGSLRDDGIE